MTGAAAVLLVSGALSLLFGLMGTTGDRLAIDVPVFDDPSLRRAVAFGLVIQGSLLLLAGWLVLRLRPAGRILGIILASLGILGGLAQLRATGAAGFLAIALDAFVLYGLLAYGFVFRQGAGGR